MLGFVLCVRDRHSGILLDGERARRPLDDRRDAGATEPALL